MSSYGIARACIESIFLQYHSSNKLPIVWLVTAVIAAITMTGINKLNNKYAVSKVFHISTILSLLSFSILILLFIIESKTASFLLYIWKDLYIITLAETFWIYTDITVSVKTAKWIYGIFLAIGSIGGISTNYLISPICLKFGTFQACLAIIPLLFFCIIISYFLNKIVPDKTPVKNKKFKYNFQSVNIILKSAYLKYLLLLVASTQIIITMIDFKFNTMLQEHYPSLNARTSVVAHIHMLIDCISLSIQILTGIFFKFIGVKITIISIPIIGFLIVLLFVIIPKFTGMIILKITSKALDYSLFKSSKEILYIPLTRKEKTQGKSFIDIFIYRLSKGLTSIILIFLVASGTITYIISIVLFLQFTCILISFIIIKKYQKVQILNKLYS